MGLCILLMGCGSSLDATVSGQVTMDGQPLTRGHVSFHPVASGPVATGSVDRNGRFQLKTGDNRGLPPGEYKVTVVATDPPPSDAPGAVGALITPSRYGNVAETPLDARIRAGANDVALALSTP